MDGARYEFAYSEKSLSSLARLSKKLRRQIIAKIEALAADPHPPNGKFLQGMKDDEERVCRIRSGDYRVLYVVRGRTVVILDVGDRKDIYK